MSLAEQQLALQAAVCGFASGAPVSSAAGLAVYRQAYTARLAAALRDNYEVLARALGDEAFEALAAAYIEACPSSEPSIRWYGDRLSAFMAGPGAPWVPHPALVDIARMDWALRAAFDGPDADVLRAADLQALPPEAWPGLQLRLHPTAQLLPLAWAVEPAWRVLRAWEPESGTEAELPEPQASAHTLLVWRQGLETRWRSLAPEEAHALQAVVAGQDFAAVCERAGSAQGLVRLLHAWLAEGLVLAA